MKKIFISVIFSILLMFSLAVSVSADSIAAEAENFDIKKNFTLCTDSLASGGKYISANINNASDSIRNESHLGDVEAEYKFSVSNAGFHSVYIRIANPSAYNGDSCWVTLDGTLYAVHFGSEDLSFRWHKVVVTKLAEGEHTLRVYCREAGAMIDKFIVTGNLAYSPTGTGTPPTSDEYTIDDLPTSAPAQKPPANEHPRLLLRESDIPTIRANLNHPQNAAVYEKVQQLAQSTRIGNQASYDADLLEIMQAKAFMYLINSDKQRGEEAVTIVLNHMRKFTSVTPATDASMRNTGHFIFSSACVYDWCYDLFTTEERNEYITKCEELAVLYFEGGYPIVEQPGIAGGAGHRDENPLFKDLLAFGIAVYDEKPFVYDNIAGVLYANYFPWRNMVYPSGWNHQGVSTYGIFRTTWEAFCAQMLDVIGQRPFTDAQNDFVYKYVYFRRPDGGYVMDADETRKIFDNTFHDTDSSLFFIIGNLYKDETMKWQYFHDRANTAYTSVGYTAVNAPMYLIMNDTSVGIDNTKDLPLTHYYGSPVGAMIARTDWEEGADSPTAIAVMKPFENYFSSHQHREVGSFQFYYKGMLALDSGAYEASRGTKNGVTIEGSGWGSAHYMGYLSAPIAHNVLAVYDENKPEEISNAGQRLGAGGESSLGTLEEFMEGSHKTGEIVGYDYGPDKHTPEFSYIEGDLTAGYRDDRVSDYSRSYMFLNLFDEDVPAALIVFDRMTSTSKNYRKAWLLHSQEEPEVSENNIVIRRTELHNNGRMINTVLLPENPQIEKVGGEGYEYWTGTQNLDIIRENNGVGDESGSWRIEISPDTKSTKDYFLNVMQVSDNDSSVKPLNVTYNEQGSFVGVFIADRAVFMKKDKGTVNTNFTVTANGSSEISYIITNLAEGKWTVKNSSGNVIATETVDSEHGVLRFRANAGTYSVSFASQSGIHPKEFGIKADAKTMEYKPVSVYIDENYNGRAILHGNVIMMALEDMAKHTGSAYAVNGNEFTATGVNGIISGSAGKSDGTVNGKSVQFYKSPVNFNGTVYVALNDLAKAYDFSYTYDELTYIMRLECTPKAKIDVGGVSVESLGWYDTSGKSITEFTPGKKVILKADIARRFDLDKGAEKATIYAALFDGEELIAIETDTEEFENYGAVCFYELSIDIPSTAVDCKPELFFLKSGNLKPMILSGNTPSLTGIRVGGVPIDGFDSEKLTYDVTLPDYISDTPYIVCYSDRMGISAKAEYADSKILLTVDSYGKSTEYTINLKRAEKKLKVVFDPSTSSNDESEIIELNQVYTMRAPDIRLSDTTKTLTQAMEEDANKFGEYASLAYYNRDYIYYDNVPEELIGLKYYPTDYSKHRYNSYNTITVTTQANVRLYFSSRDSIVNEGAQKLTLSAPLTMRRILNASTAIGSAKQDTMTDNIYYIDLIIPVGETSATITLNTAHPDWVPVQFMYEYIK